MGEVSGSDLNQYWNEEEAPASNLDQSLPRKKVIGKDLSVAQI